MIIYIYIMIITVYTIFTYTHIVTYMCIQLCMYGSALQPPLPPHGHGPVCTLYVGGFVSDIVDMSLAYK